MAKRSTARIGDNQQNRSLVRCDELQGTLKLLIDNGRDKDWAVIKRVDKITIGVHKVFIRLLNVNDSHIVAIGVIKDYCHQSWIE